MKIFLVSVLLFLFFTGCGKNNEKTDNESQNDQDVEISDETNDETNEADPVKEAFYDDYKIHDISVVMTGSDFNKMVLQRHSFADIYSGEGCKNPIPDIYTYFSADITIDGETFKNSGIRKKGLIETHSLIKPSVKIKLDEFVPTNSYHDIEKLTLNNNEEDLSHIRQCLSYKIMRDLGVAAPKCNFAKVTVNGTFLGIYTNVEPIGKSFLKNNFGNSKGNLYEGTLADFKSDILWKSRIEKKNNEEENDWSDIDKLIRVCESSDVNFKNEIGNTIDIDQFMKFWVAEVLTAHWDGYTNDTNNWYIYSDTNINKIVFIPWGTDASFVHHSGDTSPRSVFLKGIVARRFYEIPEFRKQYFDALKAAFGKTWKAAEIDKEITKLYETVSPFIDKEIKPDFDIEIDYLRTIVTGLAEAITSELMQVSPELPPEEDAICYYKKGEINATMQTVWGSFPTDDPFKSGTGSYEYTHGDTTEETLEAGGAAGTPSEEGKEEYTLLMSTASMANGDIYHLNITVPNINIKKDAVIYLEQVEMELLYMENGTTDLIPESMSFWGEMKILEGSPEKDAQISVEIKADLFP